MKKLKEFFVVIFVVFLVSGMLTLTAVGDSNSLHTYEILSGPFKVTLDDTLYTVLVPGMANNDPAIIRSGITAEQIDLYLSLSNRELLLLKLGDTVTSDFSISIRVKDRKYEDLDLRTLDSLSVRLVFEQLYATFGSDTSNKEIITINGIPYLKFNWKDEQRYATILDGDMIYIWGKRANGSLSNEEQALLRHVVESIVYP